MNPDAFAAAEAAKWAAGLAEWGQDGARIAAPARRRRRRDLHAGQRGRDPGLRAALVRRAAAGDPGRARAVARTREHHGDEPAWPARDRRRSDQSREHILLATILDAAWREGQDLDLAALIQQIQSPPVTKVGVLELEAFYPAKDRFALAMALNNLLAAPGFSAWMEGEPLDIQRLLYTPAGKPRLAIFSIAHLNDAERMFFVSLLLNQALGWMRTQSGTTSLRALIYMDEIFGYLPPVANPPSKIAAADAAEAGARVRRGRGAGDAEPGRPRLQGAVERRHVAHRPPADGARQAARARRAGGRVGRTAACRSIGRRWAACWRPRQPRVPDAQRARGRARGLREPLGAVVPARSADALADQDPDGPTSRRVRGARGRRGHSRPRGGLPVRRRPSGTRGRP